MSAVMVEFPLPLDEGVQHSEEWEVNVGVSSQGREVRRLTSSLPRKRWDISLSHRRKADQKKIRNFYTDMQGSLSSFLFTDRTDFESDGVQSIGTGTGVLTTFQLKKTYTNAGSSKTPQVRTITKPKQGTVKIYVDGVLKTETTDYTINYTTGVVTFVSAPANTKPITAEFEFYFVARFEDFSAEIENFEVFGHEITLVEVLGE